MGHANSSGIRFPCYRFGPICPIAMPIDSVLHCNNGGAGQSFRLLFFVRRLAVLARPQPLTLALALFCCDRCHGGCAPRTRRGAGRRRSCRCRVVQPAYRPHDRLGDIGIYGEAWSAIGRDDRRNNRVPAPAGNRLRRRMVSDLRVLARTRSLYWGRGSINSKKQGDLQVVSFR